MLKPKRVFKKQRNYSNVMLLKFPLEILLIVLNKSGLTVYDRAALALTCRMLALTVSREPGLLLLTQELTHGSEELHREIFNDNGFPGYNATDEDIDRWATERKQHDRDCRSRTDPKELRDFMLRLDKGWNRAQSRHCMTCNKFVPINEQYWHQKDTLFTYNCDTKTARAWRRGVCTHYERIKLGEDAREYAFQWINNDATAKNCPCCQVLTWAHCEECCYTRDECCCECC